MTPCPAPRWANEHAEQVALVQWAAWKQGATVGAERAMEGRSVKTNQALTWTHTALCRQKRRFQVLTVWHEMAVRD